MRKNSNSDVDVKWTIRNRGNWNFRNSSDLQMNTKPIAVVFLGYDEFVFRHEDIFEIIKAYHKADKLSINMIRNGASGNVKSFEKPLLDKISDLIKELKNQDNQTKDIPYLKDGQKGLRFE